ncbi:hypothetical protein KC19_2G278400 [Ceratodon purpureus]|uniref:ATP-dependent DNA helicase n=1 Tax=Ceratodon purpureus TaxID=3225 RepID=A0A8T0IYX2_CERPU|nr:hypothetical protein KC19_2G278400 [Ceratodon purpureus]
MAVHMNDERLTTSSNLNPQFGFCCLKGKVSLPLLRDPPQRLRQLFEGDNEQAKEFRTNIRRYNAAFAFPSVGTSSFNTYVAGNGPYVFKFQGELRHLSGSLLPTVGETPKYAQLYFIDTTEATNIRMERNPECTQTTMLEIQELLQTHHAFHRHYKQAYEIMMEFEEQQQQQQQRQCGRRIPNVVAHLHFEGEMDRRRYNLPAGRTRDIVLRLKGEGHFLERINECHPGYLPLHYVLLFPFGELGWHEGLTHSNGEGRLTQREYFAFRLFPRNSEFSTILCGGKLFQQFIVDAWAATEQNRLNYIRMNQSDLRANLYQGLADALQDDGEKNMNFENLGRRIILPSSHIGSARNMFELFQDFMAITRFFQHPDVFGTMTANPNWREIQEALLPGQTAADRPDIVARVFELKRNALMADIRKMHFFGKSVVHVFVIEFQKRTLPHMHFLIFLANEDKIGEPCQVDRIDPELFGMVLKHMVHGPCTRDRCLDETGQCTKRFPKSFQDQTAMDQDGYPLYRRRNDGRSFEKHGFFFNNIHVVPYNPDLIRKYNCHINIEVCASVHAVKYIHKYIYKGHDRATLRIGEEQDEIKQYLDARYIGASKAVRRLLKMTMHDEDPNVVRLHLHLPGMHRVIFNTREDPLTVLNRGQVQRTRLTEFFRMCATDENARRLTYQDFSQHYVWKQQESIWKIRERGFAIGRLYFARAAEGERFYLRLLLTTFGGPRSFEDLRTVNGVVHKTFKDACNALGLLQDDGEWIQCLEEASIMRTGASLRNLFMVILSECNPSQPELLWQRFRPHLCDDLRHRLLQHYGLSEPSEEEVYDFGIFLIDEILREQSNKNLSLFPPMPIPTLNWSHHRGNRFINEQLQWNREDLELYVQEHEPQFNGEQRYCYDAILTSIKDHSGVVFFVNGPAGTGKTFLYNIVTANVRSRGKIVICRTAHSTFKIPFEVDEYSMCTINKNSEYADVFREASLIIWDEVPMQHRHCAEAVDRSLRDIRDSNSPFGGVTLVFGGDFRQILPVIPRGSRPQIVGACLRRSTIWQHVRIMNLSINMRLQNASFANRIFAQWLLQLGDGSNFDDASSNMIQLHNWINIVSSIRCLIDNIYNNIDDMSLHEDQYFRDRTILSARNTDVDLINKEILQSFPGNLETFRSADSNTVEAGADNHATYPSEYLNSLDLSGIPLSKLDLKIGCPIILLRNLAPKQGLCNGARMVLTRFSHRVLEARLLFGPHAGEHFPVRFAFAMTINKSQGQSVKYIGLDIRVPVISHGQLYVALSRATSPNHISALLPQNSTVSNTVDVVYPEVLLQ